MRKLVRYALALLLMTGSAWAQTNPGFVTGQVPSATLWNDTFAGKADTVNGVLSNPTITNPTINGTVSGTATFNSSITATGSTTARALADRFAEAVNAKDFGATCNSQGFTDGAMTNGSNVLTSTAATFTTSDVGKSIFVNGSGAAGVPQWGTITAFVDADNVQVSFTAATTVTNKSYVYGADDTASFLAMMNAVNVANSRKMARIPAGSCYVKLGSLPRMGRGLFVGDGLGKTIVYVEPSAAGDLFSWTEAWDGASAGGGAVCNGCGPTNPPNNSKMGAGVKNLSIRGSSEATVAQNAIMFYDRNDAVQIQGVEVWALNGRCVGLGMVGSVVNGYVRESHDLNFKCFSTGTTTTAAYEISSYMTGVSDDASNEIHHTDVEVFNSKYVGVLIRNVHNNSATRSITFGRLRVEKSAQDNVRIGETGDAGVVAGIQIGYLNSITPMAGYYGFQITATAAPDVFYAITVDNASFYCPASPGGGGGINIQKGQGLKFGIANLQCVQTEITVGSGMTGYVEFESAFDMSTVTKSINATRAGQVLFSRLTQNPRRFNVRNFGAACDGTTNDRAAFDAAVDFINTSMDGGGGPAVLYVPTGNCVIGSGGALSRFTKNARVEGDGPELTRIIMNSSYTGDLFSWSEAWLTNNFPAYPSTKPTTNTATKVGSGVSNLTIVGDRAAASTQNALKWYDRADFVLVENVSMFYVKGACISFGTTSAVAVASMRESNFRNIKCWHAGDTGVPAVGFNATGVVTGGTPAEITDLNIYAPYAVGLSVRNSGSSSGLRDYRFTNIRVEGQESNPAAITADLVEIGNASDVGQVFGIHFKDLSIISPYGSSCGLKIDGPSAALRPYHISIVQGNIGEGAGAGKGLCLEKVRDSDFDFIDINTADTEVTVAGSSGGTALVQDIQFNGHGREKNWTWSVDATTIGLIKFLGWNTGHPKNVALAGEIVLIGSVSNTSVTRLTTDAAAANTTNTLGLTSAAIGKHLEVQFIAFDTTTPTKVYTWTNTCLWARPSNAASTVVACGTAVELTNGTPGAVTTALTADTTNSGINLSWTPPAGNTDTWSLRARIKWVAAP